MSCAVAALVHKSSATFTDQARLPIKSTIFEILVVYNMTQMLLNTCLGRKNFQVLSSRRDVEACMVMRLAFSGPLPQWYGGGWGATGEWPGVTERAGILRKPYATHKPYEVAPALFLLTLEYTLKPTPNPKPRPNAGSKPKAEHKPSTLTNLHPKPSLSPCRLEASEFKP